jgi:predicted nucleotidyltransferase component of viral defense system
MSGGGFSREQVEGWAGELGFQAAALEKVLRLVELLDAFSQHPALKDVLALKGGTALNLFVFDLPRLSVDIDLNYVGEAELPAMQAARPGIEADIALIARRLRLRVQAPKFAHALTSWSLGYTNVLGNQDSLKVEVNYLYRVPLFDLERRGSHASLPLQASNVLTVSDYELAAGKLTALIARRASRDLWDAHLLLTTRSWDMARLRQAFVLYGAMNIKDWRRIGIEDIDKASERIEADVLPLLRASSASILQAPEGAGQLLAATKEALGVVLPLTDVEQAFLEALLARGELLPELLGLPDGIAERARQHPALRWKALNVQKLLQQGSVNSSRRG